MTIRVLLADDQHLVRTGFRFMLNAEPDIEVVAEAGDGATALSLARSLRPDVCLLDIRMPGLDGLEVTRRIAGRGIADPLRVVVATTFDLDEYVYAALEGGATGFLLKDAGPALLIEAVRAAARGDALVSPSVTVRLLKHFTAPGDRASADAGRTAAGAAAGAGLTERETDVVRAVAAGLTNSEVAARLFISLSTVKTHLTSVHTKLAARNRVEVARWAHLNGLLDEE
ncbi:LuxR family two component transcriptional regulator [Murinocardiopsis flavida]|uniref:LuxR family two component transcriptional regulator n=1 Tax=Murinocardiopsis flavida TaxID=645275 RepID=A0A2P8DFL1_9ACTN|nr:response regulator transcription factor [Murinocardiopsis flavida]PSK95990.1 LuxR family two component transcriptional regulator [Murinocardiopsis flavida]